MLPLVPPLSPVAETRRLAALKRYEILGTPPEDVFSRIARLASAALQTPAALISFVGEQRVFYKAHWGASGRSFPRAQTPCQVAAFSAVPLVLEDAAATEGVRLAFVRQNGVRFYAGVPLVTPEGEVLGALSVFDRVPRGLSQAQLEGLTTLAQTLMDLLGARRERLELSRHEVTETRLHSLLEGSSYYAFSAAPGGHLEYLNSPLETALSYRSPPEYYRDLYPPERQAAASAALGEALKVGHAQLVTTFLSQSGTHVPVVQELVRGADGYVSALARDVTAQEQHAAFEQKRAEVLELTARGALLPAVLLELIQLLETYCEGLVGAVFLIHGATLQLEAAPQLPNSFARFLRELPLGPVAAAPGVAALSGERVVTSDIRHDPLWHNLRYFALQSGLQACWAEPILGDNEVLGTFTLYAREPRGPTDAEARRLRETAQLAAIAVTRQKLYAQLEYQARYDALTGLPNRRLLNEHLQRAVRQAQRNQQNGGEGLGVLLLDLDNFKEVNDTLGHSAGDLLLSGVAERLQAHMQAQLPLRTTLARSGGDEFVLLIPLEQQSDAARFAFELQGAFSAPFILGKRTLQITASIGVSRYPEDAETFEALLQAADTAMYATKADRRAGLEQGYRLYRSEMTEQLEAQLKLEAELKRALSEDEFRIFTQPRFELARQQLVAAEVLVRWQHPDRGLLLPGAFLGGAQKAGLLPQLDAWVLRQVARHLSAAAASNKPTRLSCNVSAVSFQDRTFLDELEAVLDSDRAVPSGLELEITENLLMQNLDGIAARLADLKVRFPGIRVAIDDFGSGYSSLAYLRHLPIDTLKIDRVFVRDLDHRDGKLQHTALAVIRTVIALGRELGFRVVAEGAETEGQLGMLTALGVDEVQGFVIGKPQPIDTWLPATPGDALGRSKFS